MAKLPAFMFYPGDWMKDPNLKRCSHAAKGVWIDMLCLLHECEERGVFQTAGQAWSDEEIAQAVGGRLDVTLPCIRELVDKAVADRNTSGAIFCRRMVRDENKRRLCSEAGKKGGNPTLIGHSKGHPKGERKGNTKGESTPSSSVLVSITEKDNERVTRAREPSLSMVQTFPPGYTPTSGWTVGFFRFYEAYPSSVRRRDLANYWRDNNLEPLTEAILAGLERWKGCGWWKRGKTHGMRSWLENRKWEDEPPADEQPVSAAASAPQQSGFLPPITPEELAAILADKQPRVK